MVALLLPGNASTEVEVPLLAGVGVVISAADEVAPFGGQAEFDAFIKRDALEMPRGE